MGDGRDRVGTDVTAIFVLYARNLLNIYPFKVAIINISPEDDIITKSSMTNISASLIFTGGGTDVTDFFCEFCRLDTPISS